MFGIGGNMFNMVSQLALAAATGGTSALVMQAVKTIGSQIAMQVIQRAGQMMGLPQPMIDLAQAAYANASGQPGLVKQNISEAVSGFVSQLDLRPSEAGQLQRQLMDASDKSYANMQKIVDGFAKRLIKESGGGDEEGGSVLMKIARALGQLMDDKMDQLATKADALGRVGTEKGNVHTSGQQKGGFTAEGQGKFGQLSAEVQALSQELSYLSQAVSSSIKGIGEAASTVARK
ncbi:MAG: hypothetical protein HC843_13575 [Sphingomonadales bacterium]|nr:hypothetical protein [Sphingomonadales bacterium]